ncbi:MAG TPA: adenylyltransferase/cytidyltransferase family protein [Candidatus Paceibacterota bacterium]|nr:adenylyltransferase/cytidyltransferase family protein [Candidatus Paceibacterota bacterium]
MASVTPASILENKTHFEDRFIPDHAKLLAVVEGLKKDGRRIVLTQGVYDLIHEGHALYLEKAKSYGDILVVGVDSDQLTKLRKGPNRPIVPQDERVKMLIHLRHVDIVTMREAGSDIGDLIRLLKPDVLVTSETTADFKDDIERGTYTKFCREIVVLPAQAATTTTARIRNLTIEGAEKLAREVNKLTEDFLNGIRNG